MTLTPSDESFVMESLLHWGTLLETVYVGVVICAEMCLSLRVVLRSPPPFRKPLHPNHCWSHSGPCCLAITTAQITAFSGGPSEVPAVAALVCVSQKSDNLHNQQFHLTPAPFFWLLFFLTCLCSEVHTKNRLDNIEESIHWTTVYRREFLIPFQLI